MEKKQLKAAAALVLVAVAAFGVYKWRSGSGQQVSQAVQTSTVSKGSLAPVLAVTGVVAVDERAVNANASGEVKEVNATVGDSVTAGQALVKIDDAQAQREVNAASVSLSSAQARLNQLKNSAATGADIAAQEAAVARANADYQTTLEAKNSGKADRDLSLTKKNLNDAEDKLKEIKNANKPTVEIEAQQAVVDKANADYQTALDAKNSGKADRDVAAAKANLDSANARLQDLKNNATAGADILAQQASVVRASGDYQNAIKTRGYYTVKSPIDGQVIAVNVRVGDQAGGSSGQSASSGSSSSGQSSGGSSGSSSLMTVSNLNQLHITASIDQADMAKVKTGQSAKITLDALPGKEFTGQITSIDPVPTSSSNVVTYSVNVSIDKLDSGVRLGMSANISIDLGKKDGVLVVPNIAIHSQGADKTVTKMIDGQETPVTVETGAADSQNTEITSGLSAGDKIVLQSFQSTSGQSSTTGGSGGNAFGGGGLGGGLGGPGRGPR